MSNLHFVFSGNPEQPSVWRPPRCVPGHPGAARIYDSRLASIINTGAFTAETTGSATALIASSQVDFVGNKHTGTGGLVCVHSHKSTMLSTSNGMPPVAACNWGQPRQYGRSCGRPVWACKFNSASKSRLSMPPLAAAQL